MKLLVVVPTLWGGGTERVVSLLTQEWGKTHQLVLVVFDASSISYAYGGRLIELAVPVTSNFFKKIINVLLHTAKLIKIIRQARPDRIISFLEKANLPTLLAAACTAQRRQTIVSIHNNPYSALKHQWFFVWMYRRLTSRMVAVSYGIMNALFRMGVPQNKLDVIYNPVLPRDPKPRGRPEAAPPYYLLAVGRLTFQKGFDRLLAAFAGLSDPRLHLVILGEGEDRAKLQAQADALGIADRVHWPGWVVDLYPWYAFAACFVLSSRYEGFGNVLVEAMSCGCPVVSFDCDFGPSEIIEHGKSGLLVKEGDVVGLQGAIEQILEDAPLRQRCIEGGQARVKQFEISQIAPQWLELGEGKR